MKLSNLIKETIDVYDFLNQNREQIMLDFGPKTFRSLQVQLTMGDEGPVRDWLIKNGYMDEEKLPFEEIETPGERNAKIVADKAKQIVKKTGTELLNLTKDVYDTPTIKRLRAYISNEFEKLIDKYGVDYAGKQMKIPFEDKIDEEYCPVCVAQIKEEKPGLWANIRAKRKRVGKAGMAKKGSKAYKTAKKAGDEINKEVDEAKTKPAKGKRFAKKVKNKKTGRTRTVSYGQAGKAKKGGDRIRPGTKKGHAYCARSAKIKKCKNPPCANTLSRKKWKCQGSRSVPE